MVASDVALAIANNGVLRNTLPSSPSLPRRPRAAVVAGTAAASLASTRVGDGRLRLELRVGDALSGEDGGVDVGEC